MRRKDAPARFTEVGRIRSGDPKTAKGYVGKARETFRLSSNDRRPLLAAQELFGGDVAAWTGGQEAFHLPTDASELPVGLVREGLHTAWEQWSDAGCLRRCDGEMVDVVIRDPEGGHLDNVPCLCTEEDKRLCNPTLQLRVVLPYLPGIGVWTFTSHSDIAAGEIPPVYDGLVDTNHHMDLVPAVLKLEKRTHRRVDENFDRNYIVPVLSSEQSLVEIMTGQEGIKALAEAAMGELPEAPVEDIT